MNTQLVLIGHGASCRFSRRRPWVSQRSSPPPICSDQRCIERNFLQYGAVQHPALASTLTSVCLIRLMQGVADRACQIRVGHGLDPQTQLSPLVSDEQFKRVTGYLDAGRQQGATVVTGASRVNDQGYFVQPTVLTETNPEMSVVREEISGPVVCAIPFDDDDLDGIARTANDTSYGLAACI